MPSGFYFFHKHEEKFMMSVTGNLFSNDRLYKSTVKVTSFVFLQHQLLATKA